MEDMVNGIRESIEILEQLYDDYMEVTRGEISFEDYLEYYN